MDAEKRFKSCLLLIIIIAIISGVCLVIGLIKNNQILIQVPLFGTVVMFMSIFFRDLKNRSDHDL